MAGNRDKPEIGTEVPKTIGDTNIVAFMRLKGIMAIPWICRDDSRDPHRVEFELVGSPEEIQEAMKAYCRNDEVGIQDFVRRLRDVKTQMYAMKNMGQNVGQGHESER
jgi:hypothetical protein